MSRYPFQTLTWKTSSSGDLEFYASEDGFSRADTIGIVKSSKFDSRWEGPDSASSIFAPVWIAYNAYRALFGIGSLDCVVAYTTPAASSRSISARDFPNSMLLYDDISQSKNALIPEEDIRYDEDGKICYAGAVPDGCFEEFCLDVMASSNRDLASILIPPRRFENGVVDHRRLPDAVSADLISIVTCGHIKTDPRALGVSWREPNFEKGSVFPFVMDKELLGDDRPIQLASAVSLICGWIWESVARSCEVRLPDDIPDDDLEARELYAEIAEEIGISHYIEAYFAGVPIQDIIQAHFTENPRAYFGGEWFDIAVCPEIFQNI